MLKTITLILFDVVMLLLIPGAILWWVCILLFFSVLFGGVPEGTASEYILAFIMLYIIIGFIVVGLIEKLDSKGYLPDGPILKWLYKKGWFV